MAKRELVAYKVEQVYDVGLDTYVYFKVLYWATGYVTWERIG